MPNIYDYYTTILPNLLGSANNTWSWW